MKKRSVLIFILLFTLLCGCDDRSQGETYTVDDTPAFYTTVHYGTVRCENIFEVRIPKDADSIVLNYDEGDMITENSVILTYNSDGENNEVLAKVNGMVYKNDIETSGTLEYYDLSTVYLSVRISESDIPHIEQGMSADISGVGFDKPSYTGTVGKISTLAEQKSSGINFECKLKITDVDMSIIPGLSAKAEIKNNVADAVLIPLSSLIYDGRFYVFRRIDGQNVKTEVSDVTLCGDKCAVGKGLSVGDVVLLDGKSEWTE